MNRNWKKPAQFDLPGIAGAGPSKQDLRREANRLVAAGSVPVTRIPTGAREIPERLTNQQRGELSRDIRGLKRSSGDRPQIRGPIDRAVPPGLVIYADGACEPNPGVGGWGFAVYRDGVEIHSECGGEPSTTNNVMELTGVLQALHWVAANVFEDPLPRIFCDSQYVVNGCNDWRHGWKAKGWRRGGPNAKPENSAIANLDLWKALDQVLTAIPIKLEWCKGHAGIIGNERADELSLMGRESVLPRSSTAMIEDQLRMRA
ncbi:ribonuclease H family protein [Arvimicrobium flavum]|uniref:ribonuclease H family protein n=1 Tax=Arvimicrobium flavum TaxID=3393320 RepID=UPI00237A1814|nr:ribonuclease H [Mesorhizobium shangrilense]